MKRFLRSIHVSQIRIAKKKGADMMGTMIRSFILSDVNLDIVVANTVASNIRCFSDMDMEDLQI